MSVRAHYSEPFERAGKRLRLRFALIGEFSAHGFKQPPFAVSYYRSAAGLRFKRRDPEIFFRRENESPGFLQAQPSQLMEA